VLYTGPIASSRKGYISPNTIQYVGILEGSGCALHGPDSILRKGYISLNTFKYVGILEGSVCALQRPDKPGEGRIASLGKAIYHQIHSDM
jgi:hypothetical protein